MTLRKIFLLSAVLASGCESRCVTGDPSGLTVRFSTSNDAETIFDHPWPSEVWRRDDGTLKLSKWPNPTQSTTLGDYLSVIAEYSQGFGRSAAIYMAFTGALDPQSLPSDPAASAGDDATLFLVDIDPDSEERGRRFPVRTRFSVERTTYLPENHLIALVPFGLPLAPNTTYALIATTGVTDTAGTPISPPPSLRNGLQETCQEETPSEIFDLLAPLRRYVSDTKMDASRIAAATVFTTQDGLSQLTRLAEAARAAPIPAVTERVTEQQTIRTTLIRGQIQMPGFQTGNIPYLDPDDGGAMLWNPDGSIDVDHHETTRVSFIIPRGTPMPPSGWPVVLMSHGTGATYRSAFSPAISEALAAEGIAVVSYDPTLHGPRDPTDGDESLTFFNLFNIVAARDNIRQGAADCVVLTRLIKSGIVIDTPDGPARFDGSRLAFLGHSQGGLVGAGCVAVEPSFSAAVFSGTSGVLTITLLERKEPLDFLLLMRNLLSLDASEPLDDFHPVLNLLQTFIDPADPISFAPHLLRRSLGVESPDILFVEGLMDSASPPRGHEAMATAAGIPVVAPESRIPEAAALAGLTVVVAPVTDNIATVGGAVTAGLIQYPQADHWPIFTDSDANRRYVEFLRSALFDGQARIVAPSAP